MLSKRRHLTDYLCAHPCVYDRVHYQAHHLIEHFCCRHRQYRVVVTRCDKTGHNVLAPLYLTTPTILKC